MMHVWSGCVPFEMCFFLFATIATLEWFYVYLIAMKSIIITLNYTIDSGTFIAFALKIQWHKKSHFVHHYFKWIFSPKEGFLYTIYILN